eukprot:11801.XXX_495769_495894_1 [CDS] Oithona nana genome sequencing.
MNFESRYTSIGNTLLFLQIEDANENCSSDDCYDACKSYDNS